MTCLSETDCGFTAFLVDCTFDLGFGSFSQCCQKANGWGSTLQLRSIQKWLNQRTADLSVADQPSLFPGTAFLELCGETTRIANSRLFLFEFILGANRNDSWGTGVWGRGWYSLQRRGGGGRVAFFLQAIRVAARTSRRRNEVGDVQCCFPSSTDVVPKHVYLQYDQYGVSMCFSSLVQRRIYQNR